MQNEIPERREGRNSFAKDVSFGCLAIVVVVSSLAVVVLLRSTKVFRAPDFLQQASSALKRGDEAAAVSALAISRSNVIPTQRPQSCDWRNSLQDSNPDEAIEYLQQIPVSDPQRANAVQQIAVLCILHHKISRS
jgi:type II secretory pathway pseudopilin PulG